MDAATADPVNPFLSGARGYRTVTDGGALAARFRALLEQHVRNLRLRGVKATGCAPCHDDRHASFSADLEKCVWYCHACNVGGGVKKFAELVGESWAVAALPRHERRRVAVSLRRRDAEQKARVILERRHEERLDTISEEWRAVNLDVMAAAELLAFFSRNPDLEAALPILRRERNTTTAKQYRGACCSKRGSMGRWRHD